MKQIVWFLACVLAHCDAWAGSLQKAFDAALANDPQHQSARAELASTQQSRPMARAGLRPNVSISWSDASVKGALTSESGNLVSSRDLDYRSPVRSLNLRMPLYNREASQKVQIADFQASFAEMVFAARTADLLDRLVGAFFQRSVARFAVQSASAQLEVSQAQKNQAARNYELGDGARTSALEADASLSLSEALLSESQNQLAQANLVLRQITGLEANEVEALEDPLANALSWASNVQLTESLQDWLTRADANSPSIAARRIAVELSKAAVSRNSSGHYPRLDLVASTTTSRNESVNTLNQSIEQQSLGLQLNLPLYSGGYVNASVTQALADQEKAQADLDAEQQSVARNVTKLYFATQDGWAKALAYQKILEAQNSTLKGLRRARLAGMVPQTDVVIGVGKVAQARTDAAKSLSEFILARIQLTTKAGNAPQEAIQMIEDILKKTSP
jgi:outer membrane protein, protease secretion system